MVTDATCYMDWIAEQYQLRLDYDYDSKASCSQSSGDKEDINKDLCWTSNRDRCDWDAKDDEDRPYDSCRLYAEEGIAKNVFQCIDTKVSAVPPVYHCLPTLLQGNLATCPNNCRGVDPNSIIGGGVAAAFIGGGQFSQIIK